MHSEEEKNKRNEEFKRKYHDDPEFREKWKQYTYRYRKINPEKWNEYAKRWRTKNPEKHYAACKRWRENNPDKWKEFQDKYQRKRALRIIENHEDIMKDDPERLTSEFMKKIIGMD